MWYKYSDKEINLERFSNTAISMSQDTVPVYGSCLKLIFQFKVALDTSLEYFKKYFKIKQ